MLAEISLCFLGQPLIRRGTQDVTTILRRKTRALLAYLALAEQPLTRLTLSHLFCQESDDPIRSLRWHLSAIRRQVAPELLLTSGETVQLNRENVWLDVAEFAAALATPLSPQTETILNLYRGEFLAGLDLPDAPEFELWLLGERARLHRLYEQGLTRWITPAKACSCKRFWLRFRTIPPI